MNGWYFADIVLRMAVFVAAAVAVPTWVRRRVGGGALSYASLTCGLIVLVVGEAVDLASGLMPNWLGPTQSMAIEIPTHGGGYLLLLMGFLTLVRDLWKAQVQAGRTASSERTRAEAARLNAAQDPARPESDFGRGILQTSELFVIGLSLADGRITTFNHGAELATGYARDEVLGREFVEVLVAAEHRAEGLKALDEARAGGLGLIANRESEIVTKSGDRRLIAWTYAVSRDDAGRPAGIFAFGSDVTEQRRMQITLVEAKADLERANAELERLASTDYLTGLVNRRQMSVLLEHEIARCRRSQAPLSLILLDLDRFKRVNDTYGHEAGDAVLKHLAEQLRSRLRASDIVARHGGEEFLVALPETDLEGAAQVAESLRRRIQETPALYENISISISSSFGVSALVPGQDLSAETLVRMADEAMYCAKKLGGNRVVTWNRVHEGQVEPSLAAFEEVHDIEKRVEALTQRNDEIILENMFRLAESLDARVHYTDRHCRNVTEYAVAIAREMGFSDADVEVVYRSAMLHDLGKAAIPAQVLWKTGPLSKADWALVCQHPVVSVKIVERLKFLRREPMIIRHHHERPDGRGYPDQLAGEAVPLVSRILAVADAMDAMTRPRPHRPAMSYEEMMNQLRAGAPAQFDARVVAAVEAAAEKAGNWPLAAPQAAAPAAAD